MDKDWQDIATEQSIEIAKLKAKNERLQLEKDLLNRVVDRRNISILQLETELSKWHEDKWVTWKPIEKVPSKQEMSNDN